MFKKYSLISIFSLIFMYSCIEEIDLKTFNHESKIVINSLFSPDSNFYVVVSKSSAIKDAIYNINLSENDTIPFDEKWYIESVKVANPKVELWKNNTLVEELLPAGLGVFRSNIETPQYGVEYEIKVSAPDLKSVSSKNKIPPKVEIINVEYQVVGYAFDNDIYYTKVNIMFNDPADQINYYEILSPNPSYYLTELENQVGVFFSIGYLDIYSDDAVIKAEGDQDMTCDSFVFSDKLINGKKYNLSIYLSHFLETCEICPEFKFNIELRSISYEYYLYRKKMRKYLNYKYGNTSNLQQVYTVGEPVILYSNVENGYGVFVGYSSDTVTIHKP